MPKSNTIWTTPAVATLGLTGAVAASRYVGATSSGAPSSGTFLLGDFVIDQTGKIQICTAGGSPGTWTAAGGGASGGVYETTITGNGATTSFNVTPTITPVAAGAWSVTVINQSTGQIELVDTAINQSTNVITLSFVTAPVNALVYSVLVVGATGTAKVVRTVHTFAIQGTVTVVTVPGFFASLATNETINLVKARYKIASGTNVTFKIQKNGSDWTGYGTTASPLTATTTAATTTQTNALAEDDFITLVLVGVSGSPVDLTVTCVLEHTV